MSVLCCQIPDFLIRTTLQHEAALMAQPLVLLGPDERVWALSAPARASGVQLQMRAQQAQMRCPDLQLRQLDLQSGQSAQATLVGTLAQWELPVEPLGWGIAYVDLHTVAKSGAEVQPLAIELGRRVRTALGADRQPALGWDSGKFTARAAASCTRSGAMRLVDKADEVTFLAPLSISLLPLPAPALQQLHWLGIRTLGEFAALPSTAIWQRFGQAGKLAQRWAQGRDTRPVGNQIAATPETLEIEIDPPSAALPLILDAIMAILRPLLHSLSENLRGCRHLHLQLHFVDGDTRTLDVVFVEATADEERIQKSLHHQLSTLIWPAELSFVHAAIVETGEMSIQQMSLFSEVAEAPLELRQIALKLKRRYGPCFFQGTVHDAMHPVAARRASLQLLS